MYLDMGQPMQQVLQSLLENPSSLEYELSDGARRQINILLSAFEQETARRSQQKQVPDLPVLSVSSPAQAPTAIALLEPLTARA
ncbi:hypothetical protein KSC_015580 [Ktedonobacter sp. SOSP1-52]|uniref:hypothetical protein n=1 Tax=Ktedonobacter sp. SOSP1-52 TaxID=2778366 RepID=UPI001916591F|nr:hypothetical protein [Ktedonobacter sp. SOSP1-52]GHO62666.1 hypothetical protein KSC_015580 [Ktedonobacter sp. SOSP1-52]